MAMGAQANHGEYSLDQDKIKEQRGARRKQCIVPYETIKWIRRRRKLNQDHVYIKTQLIEKQKDYLSRIFAIFDRDGSGSIDLNELKSALIEYGYDEDKADDYLDVFAKMPSVQDDGEIEFDEFVHAMATASTLSEPKMFYFHQDQVKCEDDQGAIRFTEFASNYERMTAQRKIQAGSGEEGYAHFKQLFSGSYNVSKASIRVHTKDMSKAAIKKLMAEDLKNRKNKEKMLDVRLEMEGKQHAERQKRKERRRHRRRRRRMRDKKSEEESTEGWDSTNSSRPETRQSHASSRPTSEKKFSEISEDESNDLERKERIVKLIQKYSGLTPANPRMRSMEPRRKRKQATRRRNRKTYRMRSHNSKKNADLRLKAFQIARNSTGSKDPSHSNSLPQIMATANMLTLAKMRKKKGSSSMIESDTTTKPDKSWLPPRMSATVVYKRAAAVIGLKSVQSGSEQLRLPSRGSIVRSIRDEKKLRETVSLPAL